ncbi:hypothetical protein JOQ06_013444 [Pogonophryne albipinna]|uniref:Uncharacterized protein n=1 Tax=Pogonophryne albipinna TaxID=1090488 RepID=A0AAD6BJ05_9TELE|nr:hypothetical protein JOQ06_013444 [Pogonophryne albipinna]
MPNTKKTPKTVDNATQQHLVLKANASLKPANVSLDMSVLNSAATEPTNTAILELLQKLSEDQTKHFTDLRKELSETRRAVVAVEEKLADVLTQITSAEARLDMLEDTEDRRRNSPPALASEVETLNAKLVEYEDRDRRVNLRIYGFPEHSEEKDALSFLRTALPDILQTDFPGGLDLERAHSDSENLNAPITHHEIEKAVMDMPTNHLRKLYPHNPIGCTEGLICTFLITYQVLLPFGRQERGIGSWRGLPERAADGSLLPGGRREASGAGEGSERADDGSLHQEAGERHRELERAQRGQPMVLSTRRQERGIGSWRGLPERAADGSLHQEAGERHRELERAQRGQTMVLSTRRQERGIGSWRGLPERAADGSLLPGGRREASGAGEGFQRGQTMVLSYQEAGERHRELERAQRGQTMPLSYQEAGERHRELERASREGRRWFSPP